MGKFAVGGKFFLVNYVAEAMSFFVCLFCFNSWVNQKVPAVKTRLRQLAPLSHIFTNLKVLLFEDAPARSAENTDWRS